MKHIAEIRKLNGENPALAFRQGHFEKTSVGLIYVSPSDEAPSPVREDQNTRSKGSDV